MGNILGGDLDRYVNNQIRARQNLLSKALYPGANNLALQTYNTDTSFIRLASSVNTGYSKKLTQSDLDSIKERFNIQEDEAIDFSDLTVTNVANIIGTEDRKNNALGNLVNNLGFPEDKLLNKQLARNFILYGGASATVFDGKQAPGYKGLNRNIAARNAFFTGAYGWGGIEERGWVPMPGITSADIQYYNNGALASTTVNIKAWTRRQFALIDVLYLRPGYTCLLEFGHTTYFDNAGIKQTFDDFYTPPLEKFLNPNSSYNQFSLFNDIEKHRESTDGNYDALYGKISKFNWTFNNDGSYDITIKIVGLGNIIESLKIPANPPSKDLSTAPSGSTPVEGASEVVSTLISEVNDQLSDSYDAEESSPEIDVTLGQFGNPGFTTEFFVGSSTDAFQLNVDLASSGLLFETFTFENEDGTETEFGFERVDEGGYSSTETIVDEEGLATDFAEGAFDPSSLSSNISELEIPGTNIEIPRALLGLSGRLNSTGAAITKDAYVKLGGLFALIEYTYLVYSKKGENTIPFFRFDINYDELERDDNFILKYPGSVSCVPEKVLVPYTNFNIKDVAIKDDTFINETLRDTGWDQDLYVGRLMNVWVNMNILNDVFKNVSLDENGEFSLLDFIKLILREVTTALGSINNIEIISTTDGLIKFIEKIPQRFVKLNKPGLFSRQGGEPILGYGVKIGKGNFVRDVKLNSELSNKFATEIAIGAQAQSNANQKGNNGTTFANYNAGLIDRIIPERRSLFSIAENSPTVLLQQLNTSAALTPFFDRLDSRGLPIDPTEMKNVHSQFANLILGELVGSSQLVATSFLPFNVSFSFNGISGLKLFQGLDVDPEILPPSLTFGGARLIIKSINHRIDENGWVTNVETLSSPAPVFNSLVTAYPYPFSEATSDAIGSNPYLTAFNVLGGDSSTGGVGTTGEGGTSGGEGPPEGAPEGACNDGTSEANVDTQYPRSTKWSGEVPPIFTKAEAPSAVVSPSSLSVVTKVYGKHKKEEFYIAAVKTIERMLGPSVSLDNKFALMATLYAIARSEQSLGGTGGQDFGAFNNNIFGIEAGGAWKAFQASDITGRYSADDAAGLKGFFAYKSIAGSLTSLLDKMIDRNMFSLDLEPFEHSWRYYRDWNAWGYRSDPDWLNIGDCGRVEDFWNSIYKSQIKIMGNDAGVNIINPTTGGSAYFILRNKVNAGDYDGITY